MVRYFLCSVRMQLMLLATIATTKSAITHNAHDLYMTREWEIIVQNGEKYNFILFHPDSRDGSYFNWH